MLRPARPSCCSRSRFEKRRAAIVTAAVEVMNRKGLRGMTIAEVARNLRVVPSAVNYYFRVKEDLAVTCFLQAIEHYDRLIAGAEAGPTPQARLRDFLHAFAEHLTAADEGRADAVATFNDVRTLGDTAVNAAYTEMFRRFRRLLDDDAEETPTRAWRNARTHLVLSQVFWAVLWLRQYEPVDYVRMIERMLDVISGGLASPNGRWEPIDLPLIKTAAEPLGRSQESFLRAATEMVNAHGYLGASVTRISARLKVTRGSFYHHNQAKDDLVQQCFDRTLEIMRRAQIAADGSAATGLQNLASLASSMIERDVSGELPLLRTSALTAVPEDMQSQLVRRFNATSARLASVVSDGIRDGSVRPVDASVAAQMVTCLINASVELHHWTPDIDGEGAVEIYVRPLFLGVWRQNKAQG